MCCKGTLRIFHILMKKNMRNKKSIINEDVLFKYVFRIFIKSITHPYDLKEFIYAYVFSDMRVLYLHRFFYVKKDQFDTHVAEMDYISNEYRTNFGG